MIQPPRPAAARLALAGIGLALAAPAHAGFTNPHTPSFRGQPHTEYSGWETFSSAHLGANVPDDPASSSDDALLVQTSPGAFLTGGNIYSFNVATTFELSDVLAGDVQQVAFQTATKGSELDYGNVRLRYVDAQGVAHDLPCTSATQLAYVPSFGVDVEMLFEWDLAPLADRVTSFVVLFEAAASSLSLDALMLDVRWTATPEVYCVAHPNSAGCTPAIASTGYPSVGSRSPFPISATHLLPGTSARFFYGSNGAAALPFHGATLCAAPPLRRTPVQPTGGTGGCTGALAFDFNTWIETGVDAALVPGARVWGQVWGRDSLATGVFKSTFTNGITFVIEP